MRVYILLTCKEDKKSVKIINTNLAVGCGSVRVKDPMLDQVNWVKAKVMLVTTVGWTTIITKY